MRGRYRPVDGRHLSLVDSREFAAHRQVIAGHSCVIGTRFLVKSVQFPETEEIELKKNEPV